jgi:phosphoribosylformylglycinamidine cyclo-ligase
MIVCVAAADEAETLATLTALGETVYVIGELTSGEGQPVVLYS